MCLGLYTANFLLMCCGGLVLGYAVACLNMYRFAAAELVPTTQDWLRTARNLVKYAGGDDSYRDLERYLKANKLL